MTKTLKRHISRKCKKIYKYHVYKIYNFKTFQYHPILGPKSFSSITYLDSFFIPGMNVKPWTSFMSLEFFIVFFLNF